MKTMTHVFHSFCRPIQIDTGRRSLCRQSRTPLRSDRGQCDTGPFQCLEKESCTYYYSNTTKYTSPNTIIPRDTGPFQCLEKESCTYYYSNTTKYTSPNITIPCDTGPFHVWRKSHVHITTATQQNTHHQIL